MSTMEKRLVYVVTAGDNGIREYTAGFEDGRYLCNPGETDPAGRVFLSWAEAHKALVERAKRRLDAASVEFSSARDNLAFLKTWTDPTIT